MRVLLRTILVLSTIAMAGTPISELGSHKEANSKGMYGVADYLTDQLGAVYGLAIKDGTQDSMWLTAWGDTTACHEIKLSTGEFTGNSWLALGDTIPRAADLAYCEYSTSGQFLIADATIEGMPGFLVYDESGTFIHKIYGPSSFTSLYGIGAGNGFVYVASQAEGKIAWGAYTGTETAVSWAGEAVVPDVFGLAVYDDYLFVCKGIQGIENMLIYHINPDGSFGSEPIWSAVFDEPGFAGLDGGIDYDGTYLYVLPQYGFVFKLTIDFNLSLSPSTWGNIKTSF